MKAKCAFLSRGCQKGEKKRVSMFPLFFFLPLFIIKTHLFFFLCSFLSSDQTEKKAKRKIRKQFFFFFLKEKKKGTQNKTADLCAGSAACLW